MRKRSDLNPGCLFFFGMPFAGVGVFMAVLTLNAVGNWRAAQHWADVPATISSVKLNSYSDEDGTTYEVVATYNYSYEGRSYTGNRVGVFSGSDNIGSYHQDLYERLQKAESWKEQVPCYVNPADPQQAFLDRSMRWGMIAFYMVFLVMFGGVGFGMMGVMGYQMIKRLRVGRMFAILAQAAAGAMSTFDETSTDSSPQSLPKTVARRAGKHSGAVVMHTDGGRRIIRRSIGTIVWNVLALPLAWVFWPWLSGAFQGFSASHFTRILILILIAVGLLYALNGLFDYLHWRKFGLSTLSFESSPRSGQTWTCVLTNDAILRYDKGFRIELERPAKNKLQGEADPVLTLDVHPLKNPDFGLYLPFEIKCPPSDFHHYHVTISADIPGLDYNVSFPIDAS